MDNVKRTISLQIEYDRLKIKLRNMNGIEINKFRMTKRRIGIFK